MRLTLAALALAGLLAAGCLGDDDDGVPVLLTRTATPEATAAATATPVATATPTATPTVATTPTATPTPRPTRVPAPTATPGAIDASARDLEGAPFSTVDVRAAVQSAGYTSGLWEGRSPLCPGASVEEFPFWAANPAGSDFGPVFVLWVYPDIEALRADWTVEIGEAPTLLIEGCELPTGFVYWNNNVIMAFEVWAGLGEEFSVGEQEQSPGEHPVVEAFLSLTP